MGFKVKTSNFHWRDNNSETIRCKDFGDSKSFSKQNVLSYQLYIMVPESETHRGKFQNATARIGSAELEHLKK